MKEFYKKNKKPIKLIEMENKIPCCYIQWIEYMQVEREGDPFCLHSYVCIT